MVPLTFMFTTPFSANELVQVKIPVPTPAGFKTLLFSKLTPEVVPATPVFNQSVLFVTAVLIVPELTREMLLLTSTVLFTVEVRFNTPAELFVNTTGAAAVATALFIVPTPTFTVPELVKLVYRS